MIISKAMTALFDLLTLPFAGHATWALVFISVLTGVLMLLLFKWTTRQSTLAMARGRLFGHLYELGLYQDDLGVMLRIQKDLLVANARYILLTLPALLILLPLAVVVLVQLEARYQHPALEPGDTILLSATLKDEHISRTNAFSLDPGPGLTLDVPPVRDSLEGRIWWRLSVTDTGLLEPAIIDDKGGHWTLPIKAEPSSRPYSPKRFQAGFLDEIFSPAAEILPGDAPLALIEAKAGAEADFFLQSWFWIFCVASILGGLAFKKVLKVEI